MYKKYLFLLLIAATPCIKARRRFEVNMEHKKYSIPSFLEKIAVFKVGAAQYNVGAVRLAKYICLGIFPWELSRDYENSYYTGTPQYRCKTKNGYSVSYEPRSEWFSAAMILSANIATDVICNSVTQPLLEKHMVTTHPALKHVAKTAARAAVYTVIRNAQEFAHSGTDHWPTIYLPIFYWEA